MRFRILLQGDPGSSLVIPCNYPYPLSAAIYRIIQKGDADYAAFLHESGYGKGFKLFTFSQIRCPFRIVGDRMQLLENELSLQVAFHLPETMESFVKGLFQSEEIVIADKKSRAAFKVKTVESLPDGLSAHRDNEIVSLRLRPLSPVVAGAPNEQGMYDFLRPEQPQFVENLKYNWRNKAVAGYDATVSKDAPVMIDYVAMKAPPRSRLITIKSGTPQETKIRGWLNFGLNVTAEVRLVKLLLNAGAGLYNAQGMGCMEVVPDKK